jgi:hypothetical protein
MRHVLASILANEHLQSDVETYCRQFILGICQAMMLFGDWQFRLWAESLEQYARKGVLPIDF